MADVRPAPAAPPPVIRRADYRPPVWTVPEIALEFDLDPARTVVRARLKVARQAPGPLRLDGDGLEPVAVRVDGVAIDDWTMDDGMLIVPLSGDAHVVETEVALSPETNTNLMGLYASGGLLCTQCEAEGFRRITFFPDRPDVLSRYTVRLTADAARYPVLLSNGDRVDAGTLDDGRHWAEWRDPFPKPSYLFALVAGDLVAREDRFTTMSGRDVALGIWTRPEHLPRTAHAMQALKDSMAWDERVYGREYDLGLFNIVAVDDFNFGAMENKGLNIFNSRYILADPEVATDADYDAVAGVVAHEYFHNWSGNRVTCRDWFQLSLKEGFTVFRDQQFSADHGSAAVSRIETVRMLRAAQFPEDAGPLAHPIRPDSYLEISNFYTATIYNKGAEIIRMMHVMLGAERFRRATDLYFDRHDGTAATCEDFVQAMEEGGGIDLSAFRLWYAQAGTPHVSARVETRAGGTLLRLTQSVPPTPGQPIKQPMPIPLRIALFGRDTGAKLDERLVMLDGAEASVSLPQVDEPVALSINRGFSAPVILTVERAPGDLAFLAAHDDDGFARYEAIQGVMLDLLVARAAGGGTGVDPAAAIEAVARTLVDPALDRAFVAEAVLPPSESFVGDQMLVVAPDAIHDARQGLRAAIGRDQADVWAAAQADGLDARFTIDREAQARRRLRGIALGYLMAAGEPEAPRLALDQMERADNMTDRLSALSVLASSTAPERTEAIRRFHDRYRAMPLVIDKWFAAQALSTRDDTVEAVAALARHPLFTLANPNRVRALAASFAVNQRAFHDVSGAGYGFLADMIVAVDRLNPQTAARLTPPLGRWARFDAHRGELMRAALERILAVPGLSKDVFEQVSRSLG